MDKVCEMFLRWLDLHLHRLYSSFRFHDRRNDHRIIEIYIILFESIKILYDRDYLSFVVNLYDAKELKSFPIADVKKIIDIWFICKFDSSNMNSKGLKKYFSLKILSRLRLIIDSLIQFNLNFSFAVNLIN